MGKKEFILTSNFCSRNIYKNLVKSSCLNRFKNMCVDYLCDKGAVIETVSKGSFDELLSKLNVQNVKIAKDKNNHYYFTERVRYMNKSGRSIMGFFDATNYIHNASEKRKHMLPGVVAFLECGGVVRFENKDYCHCDIDELKDKLK